MRHQKKRLNLNRDIDHKNALLRNLATSLILYEKIKTTKRKAKAATPLVHRLILTAKKENKMNAIRKINQIVYDKNASKKLIEEIAKRYSERNSGFTRIVKIGRRVGDNAEMVQMELV